METEALGLEGLDNRSGSDGSLFVKVLQSAQSASPTVMK